MKSVLIFFVSSILVTAGFAQWSDDPSINTFIAGGAGEQVLPKAVTAGNGYTYVSWLSSSPGGYLVRLQLFDLYGTKLWAEEGLLVSDHPSMTWTTDYDLSVDHDNCAIIAFSDVRNDPAYYNVVVYRISPEGTFLWGPDGISLSNGNYFEPNPKIAVPSDNCPVFFWQRSFNSGGQNDVLMMQKISQDGTKIWGNNGKTWQGTGVERYGWPQPVVSDSNRIIIAWVKTLGPNYYSPKHLYVQKVDSLGNKTWIQDVPVLTSTSLYIIPYFSIVSDQNGGTYFSWFDERVLNYFHCFAQHVDRNGSITMPDNGASLSSSGGTIQLYPSIVYLPMIDRVFCYFLEEDQGQNNRGISGQKLDPSGQSLWEPNGKVIISKTGKILFDIIARIADTGMVVFYTDNTYLYPTDGTIWAMRIDTAGNFLWTGNKKPVSDFISYKSEKSVTELNNGQWIVVWSDIRNNDTSVYGQNIKLDGSLGPVTVGLNEATSFSDNGPELQNNYPNPFTNITEIRFSIVYPQRVKLSVESLTGEKVKTLIDQVMFAGNYTTTWDGKDQTGVQLPGGIYIISLRTESGLKVKKIVLSR